MKTKLTRYLMAALLGVALTINLHAQTSAFTYQGQLTDNGSPANGLYNFNFTVWDSATGGSPVSLGFALAAVPVTNGLFTVTLDFGPGVFDGNARWLDIATAATGNSFQPLTPRQLITSAPYAIRAANAA